MLLAGLAGLVLASLAPLALGYSAHVVVSGSMAPRINAGDVVLTQPVTPTELRPGQVLLFADPQRPGGLLLHRSPHGGGRCLPVSRESSWPST